MSGTTATMTPRGYGALRLDVVRAARATWRTGRVQTDALVVTADFGFKARVRPLSPPRLCEFPAGTLRWHEDADVDVDALVTRWARVLGGPARLMVRQTHIYKQASGLYAVSMRLDPVSEAVAATIPGVGMVWVEYGADSMPDAVRWIVAICNRFRAA